MSDKVFIQVGNDRIEADQQMLNYLEAWKNDVEALEAEQEARKLARQSALAKLAALGLTEAEIAVL
jgi:hypothetical protein